MRDQNIYVVNQVEGPINGMVCVPGSKSITNRALLLSSMAKGKSRLEGVLFSEDTRAFMQCLIELGFEVDINEKEEAVQVTGGVPKKYANINVQSAGTAARFLTALLAVQEGGVYRLTSSEQMMRRPMKPLLGTLSELGAEFEYEKQAGSFPFILRGGHSEVCKVTLEAEKSSQFLSALLMTGCLYEQGLYIQTIGKKIARPYVDITTNMIRSFKGSLKKISNTSYQVKPNNTYMAQDYYIEPDVSGACYFYAMAALTGGTVVVKNVYQSSIQGDIEFLDILEQMGCQVTDTKDGIQVKGPKQLKGIDVDLNNISDQTMTLAALAPFASSPTTIRNIEHIKYQESNRMQAVHDELIRMGIQCEYIESGLRIEPGIPKPCSVRTYDDHRMAMAFSLVGLKIKGIQIENPSCVSKTFENYFEVMESLVDR